MHWVTVTLASRTQVVVKTRQVIRQRRIYLKLNY